MDSVSEHISGNKLLSFHRQLFRIISSTKADAGEYMCEAKNNLGEVRRNFSIKILGKYS